MLNRILQQAIQEKWAVGHFNVSNWEQLKAVVEAAKESRSPVMIGTSEGEREWWGLENIVALIKSLRAGYSDIFLNADHTKSPEAAKAAAGAGYDSIHLDGSVLPPAENISQTKEVVAYARSINPEISVEGELGYLRGESKLSGEKIILKPQDYTDPVEAAEFVKATGVDRLAIAIGNIHGINADEPRLDFERLAQIRAAVSGQVALVLHAASGIADEDIKKAMAAGISNIHISTELRLAWRKGLEQSLRDNPNEYAPYKLYQNVVEDIKNIVVSKAKLFDSAGRV
ncbi:MAG: class II fructose-bisphosphate aldolase [Parcubacteria group bacterium]|nr:class II fructose-bisphosphate aldolase [Parcubacteria group bacterium]